MDLIVFYGLASVAVLAAVAVIFQKNPLYSAFALVVVMCCLAGIYGLLRSPFIAVLQIIVYAGAIMVLFLFVIMLLDVKREGDQPGGRVLAGVALALVVVLALQVGAVLLAAAPGTGPADYHASTEQMARLLFSPYFLYAFEMTDILIAAALVGAVVLARKQGEAA
jgi:NADH-quinone oxidoreductase subunit J